MHHYNSFLILCVTATCCSWLQAAEPKIEPRNLWDVRSLRDGPTGAEWGPRQGLIREVYYRGEPLAGKPTRVFAYYACPEGEGPFPAMLLVHGGGGMAFSDWANYWAERGYAALAMDTAGCGPQGMRLADGGPEQLDEIKFREFTDLDARDMWTSHAVAAVVRGHGVLQSRPEVDKNQIGITGISWGGYLTCIVAGIDDQLKLAAPVYGCGFLSHNSAWTRAGHFSRLTEPTRRRWSELFDPSQYLAQVKCPMLWVNGTNDGAYPLDSYQLSYRLVKAPRTISITIEMPHGHYWDQTPIVVTFADSVLRGAKPLPRMGITRIIGSDAVAQYEADETPEHAELIYSTDGGAWEPRKWHTAPATIDADSHEVSAKLPNGKPITFFFNTRDSRGFTVSSEQATRP